MISTETQPGVGSSSGFGDGLRDAWRKSARYSVVCSFPASRGMPDRVVARGLTYARACQIRGALEDRAKAAKPVSSAWVRRLYGLKLESPNAQAITDRDQERKA